MGGCSKIRGIEIDSVRGSLQASRALNKHLESAFKIPSFVFNINGMIKTTATEEIVDFIASENLARVLAFKVSDATHKRVFTLIEKSKTGRLTEMEQAELDHYFLLEHLMTLVKIKACKKLYS